MEGEFIDAPRAIAFVALACLALGILWSLQATTNVSTWQEEIIHDPWAERATFTYEPLLADGSGALAMGEPGYFTDDAPTVRLRATWHLDDPQAERLTALGTMTLVLRHPASHGRAAWTHEEPLGDATLSGAADQPLVVEGVLDFAAMQARVEATPGRSVSGATWMVLTKVRFASAPDTTHAAEASAFEMPIAYTAPLYVFPGAADLTIVHDHTERETVTKTSTAGVPALLSRPEGPLLMLAGIVGLARTLPQIGREEEERA